MTEQEYREFLLDDFYGSCMVLDRLQDFIELRKFDGIDFPVKSLQITLEAQIEILKRYIEIVKARLDAEGIEYLYGDTEK